MRMLVPSSPTTDMTRLVVASTAVPPNELTIVTKKMSTRARKALPASTVRLSRVAYCESSRFTTETATNSRPENAADAVAAVEKNRAY